MDFTRWTDEQLRRHYAWHVNDNGTETMEQEMRRMYLLQEMNAEAQRRGIALDA